MQKYHRLAHNALKRLKSDQESKIIAILGARQVGKTTAMTDFAADWNGITISYLGDKLEDALLWRGKFSAVKNDIELKLGSSIEKISSPVLLIFDEIQKIPESFNNLKVLQDGFNNKIKIAISGSSSLSLLHRASESLGGRVEIINMYPLSFTEIFNDRPSAVWLKKSRFSFEEIKENVLINAKNVEMMEKTLNKAVSFGFFPEAYLQEKEEEVKLLHQNYHRTYIEKDIRDLREIGNALDFDIVWKIAHSINGQLLNYTNISKESGLSLNTVKKYVSVLSASFNIELLSPLIKNIRKRVVKSPKVFSVDNGYFNHCTGLYAVKEIISAMLIGKVFEQIMTVEFFKQERSFLSGGEPYFYRTSAGSEVDLAVESGGNTFAYEFKYSNKISPSDFSGIKSLSDSGRGAIKAGFVVSRCPYVEKIDDNLFTVPWWFFTTA